jgi:hypothetical protein
MSVERRIIESKVVDKPERITYNNVRKLNIITGGDIDAC